MEKQLITQSRKSSNDVCRKKHWWEYEVGIRKLDNAKALRMGSRWHECLDGLKQGKLLEQVDHRLRLAYLTVPEGYDEYDWRIEHETLARLLSAYQWRWENSGIEVLATERPYHLPLINPETGKPSTNFDFAGVIDGIVRMEDSRLAVMEHKLLGEDHGPDSDLRRRLRIDQQISFYVYAARQLKFDVATVLYDVARKPSIKPSPVPLRDDENLKIVFDESGNRVRNASKKPKKTCENCGGFGETESGLQCPCTLGPWRQTGDKDKGYVLQTRSMTIEEWGDKLTNDIGERPDWYFGRIEIPRLDDEIEEACHELWQVQKTIRESQKTGRWYRTVNRNSCPFCAYFELCTCKFDPASGAVPEGFEFVENKHPELGEVKV